LFQFSDLIAREVVLVALGAAQQHPNLLNGHSPVIDDAQSAALAATTHAPLTAAVMAFELSGDYSIVLPLLALAPVTFVLLWIVQL